MAERPDAANPATGSVRYVDPEGLNKNPAFTNVVVVEGPRERSTWAAKTRWTPPAT